MLDTDAPATLTRTLIDRERAVGLALEPHGLTLIVYPGRPDSYYDIARAGDPNAIKARFTDIEQAEKFTNGLPAAPTAPEHTREWEEHCPRCDYPFTDSTEAEMLRRLMDHITYEHLIPARRDAEPDDPAPGYHGMIRIEWPAPDEAAGPYTALHSRGVAITDAVTGQPISTASSVTVHAAAVSGVTAELTMLADEDGQPLADGLPVPDGHGYRQGTFTYVVNQMTVRETAAP